MPLDRDNTYVSQEVGVSGSGFQEGGTGSVDFGVISMWVVAESMDSMNFIPSLIHVLINLPVKLIPIAYFVPVTLYG